MIQISFPDCEIGRTLQSSSEEVWRLITDTTRWHEWGTSISRVDCADKYIRKGTRGRVKLHLGIWVPFVISYFDDKRYWSWDIWGIRATGHRVEPLAEHRCNIFFEVPLLAAPYLFICWLALKRIGAILHHAT
jgi:hypothetical protein